MPINPFADLQLRFSIANGVAGNTLAQPFANQSLGGFCSTSVWPASAVGDLFGPLLADINQAGLPEYRCVFLVNNNSRLTWKAIKAWLTPVVPAAATLALGADLIAATPLNNPNPQSQAVGTVHSTPPGVVFVSPQSQAAGIILGDVPPNSVKAIWLRRIGSDNGAVTQDGATLTFAGYSMP